ncbi:TM2 domain-containing protein [Lignipirellula cremea]|uniref:TM2 domain protein n=1 Tax=Lignipirellula cremea TaxID=2528010 RepID=A0A518DT96_9BACT|nr:TM2 domain-containing protein [Lignipirellula cremea]QDU95043.1 TM2 domain protein [Lignipirellula cremea]
MPIEISCSSCDKRLRVKDDLAGKKVRCPQCKGVIEVPSDGVSVAAEDEAGDAASTEEMWFVKTDEGEDFGPISRTELDGWVADGRLNGDCQLLIEGSDQWQWASDVFPQLEEQADEDEDPLGPSPEQVAAEKAAEEQAAKVAAEKAAAQKAAAQKAAAEKAAKEKAAASKGAAVQSPKTAPQASDKKEKEPVVAKATAQPTAKAVAVPAQSIGPAVGPNEEGKPKIDAPASSFDFGVSNSPTARLRGKRRVKKMTTKTSPPPATSPSASISPNPEGGPPAGTSDKQKVTAAILCLFGALGVQRFYLGYTGIGIAQLCTCGGCGIWTIIDLVSILTDKLPDAEGRPLA